MEGDTNSRVQTPLTNENDMHQRQVINDMREQLDKLKEEIADNFYKKNLKIKCFYKLLYQYRKGCEMVQVCRIAKMGGFRTIDQFLQYIKAHRQELNYSGIMDDVHCKLIFLIHYERIKTMQRYFNKLKVKKN